MKIQENMPWYADLVNYLACVVLSLDLDYYQKKKFFWDVKHYYWDVLIEVWVWVNKEMCSS